VTAVTTPLSLRSVGQLGQAAVVTVVGAVDRRRVAAALHPVPQRAGVGRLPVRRRRGGDRLGLLTADVTAGAQIGDV